MVMHVHANAPSRPRPPLPLSAARGRGAPVRFTVQDVLGMIEQGMIPEDATTELLQGIIVLKDRSDLGDEPTVIGKKHRRVVTRLTALAGRISSSAHEHAQVQNPVVCSNEDAPEPDFAIVRGSIDNFPDRLPTGDDVTCVVEVADSSLERDVEEKLPTYAAAGVPQYIVLNLRNNTAQLYEGPDRTAGSYSSFRVLSADQELPLNLASGGPLLVPLQDLLR